MKSFRIFPVVALLISLFFSSNVFAVIDNNAPVVKLRTDCIEAEATLNNCFTDMSSLMAWVSQTRQPNSDNPLLVEIGPGNFDGFTCVNSSHINFKGSGRDKTVFGGGYAQQPAITARDCFNIHVQDLKVTGGFPAPVYWQGTGSSTWVNVHLDGALYGWTETECASVTDNTKRPVHRWWSSTIQTRGKIAYVAACSENWFWGSEIIAAGNGSVNGLRGIVAGAGYSYNRPEVHVYGSVIRVIPNPGVSYPLGGGGEGPGIFAVSAGSHAEVHIHGTGIDVIGNDMPNHVAALMASNGGIIHANATAYNMSTAAGGTIRRIVKDSNPSTHIHASYLWEEHPTPPASLVSANGADMAVETDCASTGCQITGTETHLLIYNNSCAGAGGPWFDVVTGACR